MAKTVPAEIECTLKYRDVNGEREIKVLVVSALESAGFSDDLRTQLGIDEFPLNLKIDIQVGERMVTWDNSIAGQRAGDRGAVLGVLGVPE